MGNDTDARILRRVRNFFRWPLCREEYKVFLADMMFGTKVLGFRAGCGFEDFIDFPFERLDFEGHEYLVARPGSSIGIVEPDTKNITPQKEFETYEPKGLRGFKYRVLADSMPWHIRWLHPGTYAVALSLPLPSYCRENYPGLLDIMDVRTRTFLRNEAVDSFGTPFEKKRLKVRSRMALKFHCQGKFHGR
jgi:hypothetical protein